MAKGYFHRVTEQTPTRLWINNPTVVEAGKAIDAGAVGCTCNPSYCQKILDHPEKSPFARQMLDEAVEESRSDTEAEILLQQKLAKPILDLFRPLYDRNPRRDGFVTLQGDPTRETDSRQILAEAFANRTLGANACPKIPVTKAGLEAIEALVAEDIPITSTEVFAVTQATALCETYDKACRKSGGNPPMFMAHIAGIYDDHLAAYVEKNGIDISPDVLHQAGLAITRKVYGNMLERGYRPILMGGGARGPHHFSEMVGGNVVVTVNWAGTADKLIELNPPVVHRLTNPVPQRVIDELLEKLPDFRRGYLPNELNLEEFEDFGPVVRFRNAFIKSWDHVLGLIRERRAHLRPAGA